VTSRLSSLLVQEGLVSAKKMAEAFQRQVIYGGTLDTILLEMDVIDERLLIEALGRASSLPTAGSLPSPVASAASWFPLDVAEKYRAVPVGNEGNTLRVLVTDPLDRKQLDELGYTLSRSIDPIVVPEHRFLQALEVVYQVSLPARYASLAAKLRQREPAPAPPPPSPPPPAPEPPPPAERTRKITAQRLPQIAIEARIEPAPAPEPVRKVVSDVPVPGVAVPAEEMPEQPTPRLTLREAHAPAAPAAADVPVRVVEETDATPLPLDEAAKLMDEADGRDAILEALCRGARSQLTYVALLMVHSEAAVGRLALADRWMDREAVGRVSVPLDRPSAFHSAVVGRSPYLGHLGEDAVAAAALASLGRRAPLPGLLVPIVLRERAVALLYGDLGGHPLDASLLADLSRATAAAARNFQRLILKQKSGGEYARGASGAGKLSVTPRAEAAGGSWQRPSQEADTAKARLPKTGAALAAALAHAPANRPLDLDQLVASIASGDERSPASGDALLALGDRGVEALVRALPGELRLDRNAERDEIPPLAEHGPLLSLVARAGKTAAPFLSARLSDASADVRFYAALALGELQLAESAAPLGTRLLDADAGVRQVALKALTRLDASLPQMRTLVESMRGELPGPDPQRQRWAAQALGALRDVSSVPRLIELVKSPDLQVVSTARKALVLITKQDFGTSRWRWRTWWERHRNEPRVEWMLEGLGHSEEDVRISAAEELRAVTGESFGYAPDDPKPAREEARKRWIDWWRAHGAGRRP
jgi:hypothetical protein